MPKLNNWLGHRREEERAFHVEGTTQTNIGKCEETLAFYKLLAIYNGWNIGCN